MFGLGFPELIVIFFVVLLLFGAKALPDIAKGLAQAIRMFKKEVKDIKDETDINPKDDQNKSQIKSTSDDFDPDSPRREWRPKGNPSSDRT